MFRNGLSFLCVLAVALVTIPCQAAVVVEVTGADAITSFEIVQSAQIPAMSFSLPTAYQNVGISFFRSAQGSGSTTAYLMSAIGPGTTSAAEVATTTLSYSQSPERGIWTDLFNGLSLSAGTYYLLFGVPSPEGSLLGWGNANLAVGEPTVTLATGVSVGFYVSNDQSVNPSYTPAGSFNPRPAGYYVRVQGDAVPEPGSLELLLAAFPIGVVVLRLRRRCR